MNWKWPSTPQNAYFTWYAMIWHVLWIIPYYAARLIFVATVTIYNMSLSTGGRAWDETR